MRKRDARRSTAALVGYARVSTLDQNLDLQVKALTRFGVPGSQIFTDRASGKNAERPGLESALKYCRAGDTLVVWKLDRLGRSTQDLITILDDLKKHNVKFHSLQEQITTDNAVGRMFFQMIAIFAEYERNLIVERTHAGLAAARARGIKSGRRPVLDAIKVAQARALLNTTPPTKFVDVCRMLDCSARTLRRGFVEHPPPGSHLVATSPPPRVAGAHRHA